MSNLEPTILPGQGQQRGIHGTLLPQGAAGNQSQMQNQDPIAQTNFDHIQNAAGSASGSNDVPNVNVNSNQSDPIAVTQLGNTQLGGTQMMPSQPSDLQQNQTQNQQDPNEHSPNPVPLYDDATEYEYIQDWGASGPGGNDRDNTYGYGSDTFWVFLPDRMLTVALLCLVIFTISILTVTYCGQKPALCLFVLATLFLFIVAISLPVTTWSQIRPLTNAELAQVIFRTQLASQYDLFLKSSARTDLLLFSLTLMMGLTVSKLISTGYVSSTGVALNSGFSAANHYPSGETLWGPAIGGALLYTYIGILFYLWIVFSQLDQRFCNHPRHIVYMQRWSTGLVLPTRFLDSKILRRWEDLTRFSLFTFALIAGISMGCTNYDSHASVRNILKDGQTYVNVLAGNSRYDYLDGTVFHFSYGTAIDSSRAVGFSQNGRTYCVAPMLEPETDETATSEDTMNNVVPSAVSDIEGAVYSFWAAGIDCCLPRGEFWCTAEHNYNLNAPTVSALHYWGEWGGGGHTKFGVRAVLDESQELGLRQAVRQASKVYDMREPDIGEVKFIYPTEDPARILHHLRSDRDVYVFSSLLYAFFLSLLLSLLPGAAFGRRSLPRTALSQTTFLDARGNPTVRMDPKTGRPVGNVRADVQRYEAKQRQWGGINQLMPGGKKEEPVGFMEIVGGSMGFQVERGQ